MAVNVNTGRRSARRLGARNFSYLSTQLSGRRRRPGHHGIVGVRAKTRRTEHDADDNDQPGRLVRNDEEIVRGLELDRRLVHLLPLDLGQGLPQRHHQGDRGPRRHHNGDQDPPRGGVGQPAGPGGNARATPGAGGAGALTNLTPYYKAAGITPSDMLAPLSNFARYGGQWYAMPGASSPTVNSLFYIPKFVQAAGISPNAVPRPGRALWRRARRWSSLARATPWSEWVSQWSWARPTTSQWRSFTASATCTVAMRRTGTPKPATT